MVDLLVIAPTDAITHSVPKGFLFAEEVYSEAKLKDPFPVSPVETRELQRALYYLSKRYPRRIRVRWIFPWSFLGLWFVFRYRVRVFPTVIVNQKEKLIGDALKFKSFIAFIDNIINQNDI